MILADVGVLALAKRYAPSVKIHVSTQASVSNYQAARAWHDLGGGPGDPGPGAEPFGDR